MATKKIQNLSNFFLLVKIYPKLIKDYNPTPQKKIKNKPHNSFKGVHVEVQLWERELRRKFVKSESDDYIKKMFLSPNKFKTDVGFVIIKWLR